MEEAVEGVGNVISLDGNGGFWDGTYEGRIYWIGGETYMAKKDKGLMEYCTCCGSWVGVIHLVAGVGLGFLLVSYLHLTDVMVWGWILVAAGVLGHFTGKMK